MDQPLAPSLPPWEETHQIIVAELKRLNPTTEPSISTTVPPISNPWSSSNLRPAEPPTSIDASKVSHAIFSTFRVSSIPGRTGPTIKREPAVASALVRTTPPLPSKDRREVHHEYHRAGLPQPHEAPQSSLLNILSAARPNAHPAISTLQSQVPAAYTRNDPSIQSSRQSPRPSSTARSTQHGQEQGPASEFGAKSTDGTTVPDLLHQYFDYNILSRKANAPLPSSVRVSGSLSRPSLAGMRLATEFSWEKKFGIEMEETDEGSGIDEADVQQLGIVGISPEAPAFSCARSSSEKCVPSPNTSWAFITPGAFGVPQPLGVEQSEPQTSLRPLRMPASPSKRVGHGNYVSVAALRIALSTATAALKPTLLSPGAANSNTQLNSQGSSTSSGNASQEETTLPELAARRSVPQKEYDPFRDPYRFEYMNLPPSIQLRFKADRQSVQDDLESDEYYPESIFDLPIDDEALEVFLNDDPTKSDPFRFLHTRRYLEVATEDDPIIYFRIVLPKSELPEGDDYLWLILGLHRRHCVDTCRFPKPENSVSPEEDTVFGLQGTVDRVCSALRDFLTGLWGESGFKVWRLCVLIPQVVMRMAVGRYDADLDDGQGYDLSQSKLSSSVEDFRKVLGFRYQPTSKKETEYVFTLQSRSLDDMIKAVRALGKMYVLQNASDLPPQGDFYRGGLPSIIPKELMEGEKICLQARQMHPRTPVAYVIRPEVKRWRLSVPTMRYEVQFQIAKGEYSQLLRTKCLDEIQRSRHVVIHAESLEKSPWSKFLCIVSGKCWIEVGQAVSDMLTKLEASKNTPWFLRVYAPQRVTVKMKGTSRDRLWGLGVGILFFTLMQVEGFEREKLRLEPDEIEGVISFRGEAGCTGYKHAIECLLRLMYVE